MKKHVDKSFGVHPKHKSFVWYRSVWVICWLLSPLVINKPDEVFFLTLFSMFFEAICSAATHHLSGLRAMSCTALRHTVTECKLCKTPRLTKCGWYRQLTRHEQCNTTDSRCMALAHLDITVIGPFKESR